MKRKIFNKIFVGFCLTFLLVTLIGTVVCFADTPTVLLNSCLITTSNGAYHVESRSGWRVYCLDLEDYDSGTITITFNNSAFIRYVVSDVDDPNDVIEGYTFISSDGGNVNSTREFTYQFSNIKYFYYTTNQNNEYTITTNSPDPTPSTSPSPTPTDYPTPTGSVSPTPVPTGTPEQSGIYFHFDVPLDYYFIIIIILMGGILICQLFKN